MPHDKYGFDTSDDSDSLAGYWSWSTAILLVGFSSILLFFPRLLVFLAELGRSKGDTALTPLESFLSVQFGLFMIAVAIAIVLNIPGASAPVPTEPRGANHALILPISSAAVLSSLLAYNAGQTRQIGPLSDVVFFISGTIGVFGLWTSLFADPPPKSKKTGADKHTSSFIFGNTASASKQKEAHKAAQKEQESKQD